MTVLENFNAYIGGELGQLYIPSDKYSVPIVYRVIINNDGDITTYNSSSFILSTFSHSSTGRNTGSSSCELTSGSIWYDTETTLTVALMNVDDYMEIRIGDNIISSEWKSGGGTGNVTKTVTLTPYKQYGLSAYWDNRGGNIGGGSVTGLPVPRGDNPPIIVD